MRILLGCTGISLLALNAATSTQQPKNRDSCQFKVSESATKPNVTGPENLVAITHVIEQPDSPIEILGVDFKDSWVSVAKERFAEQLRCTATVRNRSDQWIRGFDLDVYVTRTAGFGGAGLSGPDGTQDLAPGQAMEIKACGGRGDGGAPGNQVRIVVFVSTVAMDGCSYMPSKRYPHRWLGTS